MLPNVRGRTFSKAARSAFQTSCFIGSAKFSCTGPLKNVLGLSRLRVGYTAGEAIGPEIFRFFRSLGINLKQLYGQTEASVFVTIQANDAVRADSVGPPAPGVELRITDEGEVLYRSPGVFQEYYKNSEATAETKTSDGWVHTGDAGVIDGDGHLRIIDRAKDVGRLADGTLFAPKYLENKLKFYPNIREAVTFGHERDFVTAMINIDMEAVGNWAERRNIPYSSYQELAARAGGARHRRGPCFGVQRKPRGRPAIRRLADPPLHRAAQDAGRRRRRTHPHAEGPPPLHLRALRPGHRRALRRRGHYRAGDPGDFRGRTLGHNHRRPRHPRRPRLGGGGERTAA